MNAVSVSKRLIGGYRALSVDKCGIVVKYWSENTNKEIIKKSGDVVRLSDAGMCVVCENKVVGTSGAHRFFFDLGDGSGVGVWFTIHKLHKKIKKASMVRFHKTANMMRWLGFFPDFDVVNVDLDCMVVWRKIKRRCRVSTLGIHMSRIVYPVCLFDSPAKWGLFGKLWRDVKFRYYMLSKSDRIILFGKKMVKAHPKFSVFGYNEFVSELKGAVSSNKKLIQMRRSDLSFFDVKYANVLYCMLTKRWYIVDID